MKNYKEIILFIYSKNDPQKTNSIDDLLLKYKDHEDLLLEKITLEYKINLDDIEKEMNRNTIQKLYGNHTSYLKIKDSDNFIKDEIKEVNQKKESLDNKTWIDSNKPWIISSIAVVLAVLYFILGFKSNKNNDISKKDTIIDSSAIDKDLNTEYHPKTYLSDSSNFYLAPSKLFEIVLMKNLTPNNIIETLKNINPTWQVLGIDENHLIGIMQAQGKDSNKVNILKFDTKGGDKVIEYHCNIMQNHLLIKQYIASHFIQIPSNNIDVDGNTVLSYKSKEFEISYKEDSNFGSLAFTIYAMKNREKKQEDNLATGFFVGKKKFCDGLGSWYYIVTIDDDNITIQSFADEKNTTISNKSIPTDTYKGKIKGSAIVIEEGANGGSENKFKYEYGVFSELNNEGGYNDYTECN